MFEAANPKWLNATVKVTTAFAEIDPHVDDCKSACQSVEGLSASRTVNIKTQYSLALFLAARDFACQ